LKLKTATTFLLVLTAICCGSTFRADAASGQPWSANRASSAGLAVDHGNYQTLEQYGAKGDGSDDTAAFLAAHTVIQARGFGGIVLQPGRTYGINGKSKSVLLKLSNLSSYGIDAGSGAIIKDLRSYRTGETAVAFQFSNCKNIKISGRLRLMSQAYSLSSNKTGLSWFKFLSGCNGINAAADFDGGLHGFHFYRNYGEPLSSSTTNVKLNIKAARVYYPELHERSGDNVETTIDTVDCGRAFFIFGGGNNVNARITTRNGFGFLLSSDSMGNGAENISIDYRDRDSDKNRADFGRCGLQFYNQRPATFRNIRVKIDVKNNAASPFYDSFFINKVNDSGSQDKIGRGHVIDGLDIAGVSEQVHNRKHVNTYGLFAAPDKVSNVRIHDFKGSGQGSDIQLSFGNALANRVLVKNVSLPPQSIKLVNTSGKTVFINYSAGASGSIN